MTDKLNDVIADDALDTDWCPECGSDDVIDLQDGNQRCSECGAIIDY